MAIQTVGVIGAGQMGMALLMYCHSLATPFY